ncbi:MAG: hypothetical protein LBI03_00585, partial [Clostridiales bacterium]|nr:hypothetical protein [Clostridiales bacterium]
FFFFLKVQDGVSKSQKSTDENCRNGGSGEAINWDKDNRTLIEVGFGQTVHFPGDGYLIPPSTAGQASVSIRPYKKTLGIWFWCTRTMSCNVVALLDRFTSGAWVRDTIRGNDPGTLTSHLIYVENFTSWGPGPIWYYAAFDCWADSPSTPQATALCNHTLIRGIPIKKGR